MIRAVIDTNVFVSGLISTSGASGELIIRWLMNQFNIIISNDILEEYEDVLLHLPEIETRKAIDLIERLVSNADKVDIPGTLCVCKDSDDDKFLETAVVGQAAYLITKNIRHFPYKNYQNVQIVKISKFLKVLETEFQD